MKSDKTFWNDSKLSEGEKRKLSDYHILADDLPVLLCRFKKDGTIFFVNKSYAKLFNTSKEILIGTKFFITPSEFEMADSSKPFLNQYKKQFSLKTHHPEYYR